jgi:hypothetical protein
MKKLREHCLLGCANERIRYVISLAGKAAESEVRRQK